MAKMRAKPAARLVGGVVALLLLAGTALAKDALPHIKIAIGGANCLCYLPTVLAQQLGAYEQAGVEVELINFKGGSTALTAVLGGSADVVWASTTIASTSPPRTRRSRPSSPMTGCRAS